MLERRSALKPDRSLRAQPCHVPDIEWQAGIFFYNESSHTEYTEQLDELAKAAMGMGMGMGPMYSKLTALWRHPQRSEAGGENPSLYLSG